MIEKAAQTVLETEWGLFDLHVYVDDQGKEHVALKKDWTDTPLVRIHSECATGDLFGSTFCDCGPQLRSAQDRIAREGGVLLYLRQEGRGLGLANKIKAYELQREGKDTVEANEALGRGADERSYELAAEMLRDLEVSKLRLMTNNPAKVEGLKEEGFEVEAVSHEIDLTTERGKKYLQTKRDKMGHNLHLDEIE